MSADLEDRSVLHLFQKWESQAASEANLQSQRVEAMRDYAGTLGILEMKVLKYEVAAVDSLD